MNTRQIALAAAFLAIVFIAHASGRVFQIGGAQLAPSIGIYVLMALLMAPDLDWVPLTGIALAVGILTMVATSSPFPIANIPAHGGGFLLAAYLTKQMVRGREELTVTQIVLNVGVVLIVSWTIFAVLTWFGLTSAGAAGNLPQAGVGSGIVAWWMYGFLFIALPTFVIAAILAPLLYRAVRPALVRQGMIEAGI